jgi:hypothetical protein
MTSNLLSGVEELYNILKLEAESYRQLIILSQHEQVVLQEENLTGLLTTVREKEVLREQLVQWEQAREEIAGNLVDELRLPATVSLSELIGHLDTRVSLPQRGIIEKLSGLREELINMFEQLIAINYGNQLLIHSGLARVHATFDYLTSLVASSNGNYTHGGQNQKGQAVSGNVLNWQI